MNINAVIHVQVRVSTIVIHDQVWISTHRDMNKCKYKHKKTWASVKINKRYVIIWEYQHFDTWPSVNINTGTHDQEQTLTWQYMSRNEYEKRDTWSRTNSNMVVQENMSKPIQQYMTKCGYHHLHIWPSLNMNTGIHDQERIAAQL